MWLENHCNPANSLLPYCVFCDIIESETLKFCLFTHISSFWLLRTFHVPIISLTLHSRHVSRRTASTVKKVESQRGEFVRDIHDHEEDERCQFGVHEMSPSPPTARNEMGERFKFLASVKNVKCPLDRQPAVHLTAIKSNILSVSNSVSHLFFFLSEKSLEASLVHNGHKVNVSKRAKKGPSQSLVYIRYAHKSVMRAGK